MKPRVGISLGDPSGIGAEVTLKALANPKVQRALTPVLFGDASVPTLVTLLTDTSSGRAWFYKGGTWHSFQSN